MAMEMKKKKIKMNKSIYLGMSILDISKTLMYEFWYDYIKPKYQDKAVGINHSVFIQNSNVNGRRVSLSLSVSENKTHIKYY